MRLMTNNPRKRNALEGFGLREVETVPLTRGINEENQRYLETKRDKMGHLLPQDLKDLMDDTDR
jgi:3,4-dihydroxy 2-butanone 4-phosphate synthase/GTP cyclohydrolase II